MALPTKQSTKSTIQLYLDLLIYWTDMAKNFKLYLELPLNLKPLKNNFGLRKKEKIIRKGTQYLMKLGCIYANQF